MHTVSADAASSLPEGGVSGEIAGSSWNDLVSIESVIPDRG